MRRLSQSLWGRVPGQQYLEQVPCTVTILWRLPPPVSLFKSSVVRLSAAMLGPTPLWDSPSGYMGGNALQNPS